MRYAAAAAIVLAGLASVASAQQPMPADEIRTLINGRNVDIGNDGTATYRADGNYEYFSKVNGAKFRGKWVVEGSNVCVQFPDGRRCDQFLKDGSKVFMKNPRGTLFAVAVR